MWNLVSTRITQFAYFDELLGHPQWQGRKVLDFGGNVGTFLVGAGDAVNPGDYWCIDLHQGVVQQGRREHPQAHFVHYNRFSTQYNPQGIRNLPVPDCGLSFDMILAFSVFTHVDQIEMQELVEQLRTMLAPQGVLAFTFTDPSYDHSLTDPDSPAGTGIKKMLRRLSPEKSPQVVDALAEQAAQSKWCVLIDDRLYLEPGPEFSHLQRDGNPHESYCTYFSADYVKSLFRGGEVLPPVSPEWQHCCILRRDE